MQSKDFFSIANTPGWNQYNLKRIRGFLCQGFWFHESTIRIFVGWLGNGFAFGLIFGQIFKGSGFPVKVGKR